MKRPNVIGQFYLMKHDVFKPSWPQNICFDLLVRKPWKTYAKKKTWSHKISILGNSISWHLLKWQKVLFGNLNCYPQSLNESFAGLLTHQYNFLKQLLKRKLSGYCTESIWRAIREFPHKNSQKHSVNLAENLELVLGSDHVIHIEKKNNL